MSWAIRGEKSLGRWLLGSAVVAACAMAPVLLTAAERNDDRHVGEDVGLFDAMNAGQLEVKFIQKDEKQARLIMKNLTDKPLNVRLPDAFAGVPVLAQGFGGGGNAGGGGGNQGTGGGGGGGGIGGGGNQFNIPPEKIVDAKLTTVCLEHGKPEPRPNVHYEIRPVDSFTQRPAVHELLRMMGEGKISQRIAQAAAWHLNNDMSWEELAAKEIEHIGGLNEPYFQREEIIAAMALSKAAEERAAEAEKNKTEPTIESPGEAAQR